MDWNSSPDVEAVGRRPREQVDELALEPVRVLELVHHDRAEAQLLALAQLVVVAQEIAGSQLQILEVERRLGVLRGGVRVREALQQLLQELAVAERQLVERGLLDRLAGLLVARRTLAARPQPAQVEQALRQLRRGRQRHRLPGRGPCRRRRVEVVREAPCRFRQLGQSCLEPGALTELELQLAAGRAQRLVDARQHAPQPGRPVGREQLEPLRLVVGAEVGERRREGLAADDASLALVEDPEARIEPGLEGVRLQQPQAEPVDRGDPGTVQRTGEIVTAELVQPRPDAPAQLARGPLGVRDHEQRLDIDALVADRLDEALDEHRRLARAGARGDEDLPAGRDRSRLLLVGHPAPLRCRQGRHLRSLERLRRAYAAAHARRIRHMRQRSHHAGQSPPFGSCTTSPA